MRNADYFSDEIRAGFMQIENIIEDAETLEELEIVKEVFRSEIKSVEAYFIQIENEIKEL